MTYDDICLLQTVDKPQI